MKRIFGISAFITASLLFSGCAPTNNVSNQPKPARTQAQKLSFSSINVSSVTILNGKVVVNGSTDLPNNSIVNVDFDVPQPSDATYIGVNTGVRVTNGRFDATLTPPQRKEFDHGPYIVTVLFTPRNQPASVTESVGSNGEHLTGTLVDSSNGFNTLQTAVKENIQLHINAVQSSTAQIISQSRLYFSELQNEVNTLSKNPKNQNNASLWLSWSAQWNQSRQSYFDKTRDSGDAYTAQIFSDEFQLWSAYNNYFRGIGDKAADQQAIEKATQAVQNDLQQAH